MAGVVVQYSMKFRSNPYFNATFNTIHWIPCSTSQLAPFLPSYSQVTAAFFGFFVPNLLRLLTRLPTPP